VTLEPVRFVIEPWSFGGDRGPNSRNPNPLYRTDVDGRYLPCVRGQNISLHPVDSDELNCFVSLIAKSYNSVVSASEFRKL